MCHFVPPQNIRFSFRETTSVTAERDREGWGCTPLQLRHLINVGDHDGNRRSLHWMGVDTAGNDKTSHEKRISNEASTPSLRGRHLRKVARKMPRFCPWLSAAGDITGHVAKESTFSA